MFIANFYLAIQIYEKKLSIYTFFLIIIRIVLAINTFINTLGALGFRSFPLVCLKTILPSFCLGLTE